MLKTILAMEGYGSEYPGRCSGGYAPFFPDEENEVEE
jgi:hypothetical protein